MVVGAIEEEIAVPVAVWIDEVIGETITEVEFA